MRPDMLRFALVALVVLLSPTITSAQGQRINGLFGDVALDFRFPGDGVLAIGAADAVHAFTIQVLARDARRWADSASRLLARRTTPARAAGKGKRRGAELPPRRWRAILEEPGVGGGSLVLARVDSAGRSYWTLFAADTELSRVRQALEASEARTLVGLVRRAAVAASPPPRARPRAKPRPRTPAKRPPSRRPPAGDQAP